MRAGEGDLVVAGIDAGRRPGAVRRLTGLGRVPRVNGLDETLTVADQVMRSWPCTAAPGGTCAWTMCSSRWGRNSSTNRVVRSLGAADRLAARRRSGPHHAAAVLVLDELDEEPRGGDGRRAGRAARAHATGVTVVPGTSTGAAPAADVALAWDATGRGRPGPGGPRP